MGRVQYGPKWRPTHFGGRETTGIEFYTGYSFGFARGPIIYIIGRTVSIYEPDMCFLNTVRPLTTTATLKP